MKKQIAIAMGLAVLSTGALASKARLEALGQDSYGSFFLGDSRNVTLNPAMLNTYKDFVTLEWGDTSNLTDSATTPRAEGGMFKASGNMIYGLYFGDESNIGNTLRTAAMGSASVVPESNNTSFYIAGESSVQWGVKLTYHDYADKQNNADIKSSATRATVGVNTGDIESFLAFGLSNKAENGTAEFNGKSSFQLGVTYAKNDIDYMGEVKSINIEDGSGDEYKAQYTNLGVAKKYKLNDKANVWTSAWYKMETSENKMAASEAPGDEKNTYLPVSIAMEVSARDWLTLRGSVSSEVIGEYENDAGDKQTRSNTTSVAAGASLLFGELTVDGTIGNATTCSNSGTTPDIVTQCSVNNDSNEGVLSMSNLMSRVSMTYKF